MKFSFTERILLKGVIKEEKRYIKSLILFYEICFILFAFIFIYLAIIKNKIGLISDAIFLIFLAVFVITIRGYQSLIRKIIKEAGVITNLHKS